MIKRVASYRLGIPLPQIYHHIRPLHVPYKLKHAGMRVMERPIGLESTLQLNTDVRGPYILHAAINSTHKYFPRSLVTSSLVMMRYRVKLKKA